MEESVKQERPIYHYVSKEKPFADLAKVYFAGFWIRFCAYLLDLLIIAACNGIFLNSLYRLFQLPTQNGLFSSYWFFSTLLFLLYFILMTKFFSQTLGKMLFGLKVIRSDKKTLTWGNVFIREGALRFVLKTIWPLYLVVAFTPFKQGIQDLIEETAVIHEGFLKENSKWKKAL
ncbi:RDD family protein [Listeria sp. PSOL-1]|uniref:RDD family protein n=1 Tax=Listeria sp. PSOL-1 TaxID=1844999 RepID=UPI0013D5BE3A|nr:RDD family protein [Listeria sp. PSOL-1]